MDRDPASIGSWIGVFLARHRLLTQSARPCLWSCGFPDGRRQRHKHVGAEEVHRQHGFDGDGALCPRGDTHPLVRLALGLGPLSRDGFECGPELREPGRREIELLLQGGGEEIAFGPSGQ